jgi:hypothetical protein
VSVVAESKTFARFARGLPSFLRQRITLESAREVVLRRMAERESSFLATLEAGVFRNPRSPYGRLLRLAGCEPGDVRRMVSQDGIEATLRVLRDAGVYVTFEEFKGREPIVRHGQSVEVKAEDFDNPTYTQYYQISTGGSTGKGRRVLMDLEHMRARLPMQIVQDSIHGFLGVPSASWFEIPPGSGLNSVLMRAPYDNAPQRWFTPIWSGRDGAPLRFRLATSAILHVARRSGARVPRPEYLPLERADVIARWAADTLRAHGRCGIRGHVSKVLRVAVAANELGIDLTGAVITGGGEPPTPGKVRQITATGARFIANYHFTEAGAVGLRCMNPRDENDQHLLMDHLAVIQSQREVPRFDVVVDAFCFTTVQPTAPKLMLNVEIDDYGVVERRTCGCPWEQFGFTTHLREIRSYRKLTGEGVTLIGSEMERILEEELPARFGGTPLDYQLLEEEDERGFTRLSIVVSPRVTITDESAVVDVVLSALRQTDAGAGMSGVIWKQAGTLRVRREDPRSTSRGKLMPLHVEKLLARPTAPTGPL